MSRPPSVRSHKVIRARRIPLCPCGCLLPGFCEKHLQVLHRVRDELEREDRRNMKRPGGSRSLFDG